MGDSGTGIGRTITLANDRGEIARLAEEIETFCGEAGVDGRSTHQIVLALEEIVTNILTHGYGPDSAGTIEVCARRVGEVVEVETRDRGPEFDPTRVATPDIEAPASERSIGGLGIHLARSVTDDLTYRRIGDENRITFRKTFQPTEEAC